MGAYSPSDPEAAIVNTISFRDLYPSAGSLTVPQQAQTGDDYPYMAGEWGAVGAGGLTPANIPEVGGGTMNGGAGSTPSRSGGGVLSKPVTWVIGLIVIAAGIMFTAHKTGRTEEFSSIRASAYNIFFVALVAVAGILVLKTIFGRFQVPGLSQALAAV